MLLQRSSSSSAMDSAEATRIATRLLKITPGGDAGSRRPQGIPAPSSTRSTSASARFRSRARLLKKAPR